eukprot:14533539-Alexandrium_andersonii.AAC.1
MLNTEGLQPSGRNGRGQGRDSAARRRSVSAQHFGFSRRRSRWVCLRAANRGRWRPLRGALRRGG